MAWTYEQDFNALNTAQLSGQDSWSGDTAHQVSTSNPYEGAKCVSGTYDIYGAPITRAITGIQAGKVYFAIRTDNWKGDDGNSVKFKDGAVNLFAAGLGYSATQGISIYNYGVPERKTFGAFNTEQWYLFEVDFDGSTGDITMRVHDGSSWSATQTTNYTGGFTEVDTIELNAAANTGTIVSYFDYISPTDPTATTSIKTVCGLAKASVKTIRGLAIASVKSINGLG